MSAANLLSSLKEKPSEKNQKDGCNAEGHDEEEAGAGTGAGGGGDPAVLALGPARRVLWYSVAELLRLRDSPLVKRDLENAFAGNDALALVLKRRSDSPNEDDRGARGDAPNENHKAGVYGRERERRSADPRERVRKESEPPAGGIVLSPQRRSFTSGCGAPAAAAPPPHVARTRPDSPLSSAPPPTKAEPAGRRIGSGRIVVREAGAAWEEGEWPGGSEPRDRDRDTRGEIYRPPRERDAHRTNGQDRFERRSYGRDSYSSDMKRERDDRFNNEKTRDREDNRRSGGRYNNRRYNNDEEPEWFSGGPTSQLETIELRGFDEPTKKSTKEQHAKDQEKWNGGSKSPERWRSEAAASPQPPPPADNSANNAANPEPEPPSEAKTEEPGAPEGEHEFNLDDFLNVDAIIPDVLTNGSAEAEGGSRFSRWFKRESPTGDARHYERLLHHIVDDLDSSTRAEPASEPHHVFAPISPAPAPSLLELLRRANAGAGADPRARDPNNVSAGKIHSLEELESRLRPQPPPGPDHDMSAFKRLLAQVSGGHAVPAEQRAQPPPPPPQPQAQPPQAPQPMSLLQMLSKSMEQQQQQKAAHAQPPHIPQELLYKLLQVQQRQQQQQAMAASELGAHMPPAGPSAADRELLQRPEAQAIIHGLKAGEITVQHLMQQLGNPGLQSRHRDVLLTILRLHHQHRQMGGSPLPAAAPHLVVPPHHQPLRLSPVPHPGVPTRIPSPRELAAHTQSIMQSALIKKKLEEQRENYRRRHDLPKQPTPISFTPTSVLRKMTAEKEADAPSPKQQWAQPPKMPQGRPIVKGNQTGGAPMGYAPQNDYQQYLAQQQVSGGRAFPHPPQQRQPYSMARGMPGGTTLHQLLVQSHQRSLNEMGGGAAGGGDNQLARWFSPELLARASAGKLPSVHVPNALSLEDLERHHHSPAPPVRN